MVRPSSYLAATIWRTVILDESFEYSALVTMPFEVSCSLDLNGRAAMILSAAASLMPGSFIRSSRVAELRSTLAMCLDEVALAGALTSVGVLAGVAAEPPWANTSGALTRPIAIASAGTVMRDMGYLQSR